MKFVTQLLFAALLILGVVYAGLAQPTSGATALQALPAADPTAFDIEAASQSYMDRIPADQRARSDAYFEGGYWLLLWNLLIALGIAWLLLGTRFSAKMRDFAERRTRHAWLQTAIYAAQYIVVTALLMLPWTYYEEFVREHQYGLSTQDVGAWASEQLTSLMVTLVIGSIVIAAVYAVIRRFPRHWWLWGAGVSIAFMVLLATVAPVFLAPLFNTYNPLPETPLKAQILAIARSHDIPVTDVYWFDASRQSNRISANVSGMFGTTRISLNDNLLNRTSPETVKAVLGHEMGHYVLGHTYLRVGFLAAMLLAGFAFVWWAFLRIHRRWGGAWQVRGASDVAGLPLMIALLSFFSFLMTPLDNTISRIAEEQADVFGLDAAREPEGFAEAAVLLAQYRKMRPGPWEEAIFHDHPSGWNRIQRAMAWKARHGTAATAEATGTRAQ